MTVTDTAALDPIYRLIDLAQSDTGQARRAANFLLSWWNAQNCGGFDLTDLWAVDKKVADDMLAAATFIAQHNEYPTAYGLGHNSSSSWLTGGRISCKPNQTVRGVLRHLTRIAVTTAPLGRVSWDHAIARARRR